MESRYETLYVVDVDQLTDRLAERLAPYVKQATSLTLVAGDTNRNLSHLSFGNGANVQRSFAAGTDIADAMLLMDAALAIEHHPTISTVVIVSGDGVFTGLVQRAHNEGITTELAITGKQLSQRLKSSTRGRHEVLRTNGTPRPSPDPAPAGRGGQPGSPTAVVLPAPPDEPPPAPAVPSPQHRDPRELVARLEALLDEQGEPLPLAGSLGQRLGDGAPLAEWGLTGGVRELVTEHTDLVVERGRVIRAGWEDRDAPAINAAAALIRQAGFHMPIDELVDELERQGQSLAGHVSWIHMLQQHTQFVVMPSAVYLVGTPTPSKLASVLRQELAGHGGEVPRKHAGRLLHRRVRTYLNLASADEQLDRWAGEGWLRVADESLQLVT